MSRTPALGLVLSRPLAAWATAGALMAVYAGTMATDLTFYDSPELALVAHELGVGHPIGQPLHTILGFAFTRLPGLTPHVALSMMSALFGALCVLPAWALSEALHTPVPMLSGALTTLGRAVALLGMGLSLVAWEPSSRVEVYTLATFLGLWAVAFAQGARSGRAWVAVGLALGLAASSHAVVALGAALAILPRSILAPRRTLPLTNARAAPDGETHDVEVRQARGRPTVSPSTGSELSRRRRLGALLGGGLLGLLPFGYIPLASSDSRTFAWGGITDLPAFLPYLRGADYAHNQGIAPERWLEHAAQLIEWSLAHGTLAVALTGLAGFVWLGRRSGLWASLALAAAVEVGFVSANAVFHPDVPDYRGYLALPLWMAGAGVAALAHAGLARADRFRAYGGAFALVPALALLASPSHLTQRRDTPSLAGLIARGALTSAPANAIVVVEADHWVAPLLFVQEVERRRPDVVLIAHGLSASRWYWDHVFARHPELATAPLSGPGGRNGRIRRVIDAHPGRPPVLVESWRLAEQLGLVPCGVGWLVWTRGCDEGAPDASTVTSRLRAAAPFANEALEVASSIGEARGEALWRLGRGQAAIDALLAGLADSSLGPPPPPDLPTHAPPLAGPIPGWARPSALHDPARNLLLAALLLDAVGRTEQALAYASQARQLGLPGASAVQARLAR